MTPEALARTFAAAFPERRHWTAQEFQSLLAQPGTILCGTAESFVLGRVIVDEAEILTIATHPAFRRQGRAEASLVAFEAEAEKRHATSLFLEVADDNSPARTLYQKVGYIESGRRKSYYNRPNRPASDAITMVKTLHRKF